MNNKIENNSTNVGSMQQNSSRQSSKQYYSRLSFKEYDSQMPNYDLIESNQHLKDKLNVEPDKIVISQQILNRARSMEQARQFQQIRPTAWAKRRAELAQLQSKINNQAPSSRPMSSKGRATSLPQNSIFQDIFYPQQHLYKGTTLQYSATLMNAKQDAVDLEHFQKFGPRVITGQMFCVKQPNTQTKNFQLSYKKGQRYKNTHRAITTPLTASMEFQNDRTSESSMTYTTKDENNNVLIQINSSQSTENNNQNEFRNKFMKIRQNWGQFFTNFTTCQNIIYGYQFLLQYIKFIQYANQCFKNDIYLQILEAIMPFSNLKLLLMQLIGQSVTPKFSKYVLHLLLKILQLDMRSDNLTFFKPVLRTIGLEYCVKMIKVNKNREFQQVITNFLMFLICQDYISIEESEILNYNSIQFTNSVNIDKILHNRKLLNQEIDLLINQQSVGILVSLKLHSRPQQHQCVERFTISFQTDNVDQNNDIYMLAFRENDMNYVKNGEKFSQEQHVKIAKLSAKYDDINTILQNKRNFSNQNTFITQVQQQLNTAMTNMDFEQFLQRQSQQKQMFLNQNIEIGTNNNSVYYLQPINQLTQATFDLYGDSDAVIICIIARRNLKPQYIKQIMIEPFQPGNSLPTEQFNAPFSVMRKFIREKVYLKRYSNVNPYFDKKIDTSLFPEAIDDKKGICDILKQVKDTNRISPVKIRSNEKINKNLDIQFGRYKETIEVMQQLEEYGLNMQSKPIKVKMTSNHIFDMILDNVLKENGINGTIGFIAEKIYEDAFNCARLQKTKQSENNEPAQQEENNESSIDSSTSQDEEIVRKQVIEDMKKYHENIEKQNQQLASSYNEK